MLYVHLSYKRIVKYLIIIFCVLLILHITFTSFVYFFDTNHRLITRFFKLFNFDTEQNIPTFFNSILFIISAVLFFINGNAGAKRIKRTWYLLGFIFIYLSIDEFCSLHELLIKLPDYFNFKRTGVFYFFWVVPYGLASLLLFLFLIPLIKKIPPRVRLLFIISAIIYITGAAIMESISGIEFEKHKRSFLFQILTTIEESFEMLGLILAIYAGFLNLEINVESITIRFSQQGLAEEGNDKLVVRKKLNDTLSFDPAQQGQK